VADQRFRSIVVLTGAGISAESGVPTFRGDASLWRQYRGEDLATPESFVRESATVWEWYDWRRQLIAACEPNAAHQAQVQMERSYEDFSLITQYVDDLHRGAGSERAVRLHGSIWQVRCTSEGSMDNHEVPLRRLPPHCPCGALLRPHVVWFGETLDPPL
jgi:NAD-dependent deacetylase